MLYTKLCEHLGSTQKWMEDEGVTKSPKRNRMHLSSINLIDYWEEKLYNLVNF